MGRGDLVDWKTVTPIESGRAELIVRIGDPFKGKHGLTGQVTVYDIDAREYTRQPIEPNVVRYDLTWHAEGETTYLIKLEGIGGKSKYNLEFRVDALPSNPCANVRCATGSYCENGRCVAEMDENVQDLPGAALNAGMEGAKLRCRQTGVGLDRYAAPSWVGVSKTRATRSGAPRARYVEGRVPRPTAPSGPSLPCQPECGEGTICKRGKCVVAPLGPIAPRSFRRSLEALRPT